MAEKKTTAKAEETKATKKTTTKKAETAAKKTTTKKAEATAEKKTTAKKSAEKTVAEKKTTATKKATVKCEMQVQFAGKSYTQDELLQMAKDVWKYDLNQKATDLKTVELYVKPEESAVYYVMNKDFAGSFVI